MSKRLSPDTISPHVLNAHYAVRGEVPDMAEKIDLELQTGTGNYPFDEILRCNIGNPQAVGQVPPRYFRQCLALCDFPSLQRVRNDYLLPEDVKRRAQQLLEQIPGGTGSYSHSQGVLGIRQNVAHFIAERDGFPANPKDIFLTDGASPGIKMLMQILLGEPTDGVLIPIPQYPLYAAAIQLLGAKAVGYYLDEEDGWNLHISELKRAYKEARENGITIKGLVIINPGNPTGQCMSKQTVLDVVQFCHEENLVLMADEVYQENVYVKDIAFVSAKKAARQLGYDDNDIELVSFHSTSKGLLGECGRRGGYMELIGIHPEAQAEILKLASVCLCSNLGGQVMTDLMVRPPQPGDLSYPLFAKEQQAIFDSLQRKALMLVQGLNQLESVKCQPANGAMYVFPRIFLPAGAIQEAKKQNKSPDTLYCLSLLEHTGISTVPGSGFGQVKGTHHLRMTFLPPEKKLAEAIERFGNHHNLFMEHYS